jgi:predicted alpha/beta superfamily hydrolase
MPMIRSRYRTTSEAAIVGESLAGLFVVETFLLEPDLFDTWIAFDPSLWWNDSTLVTSAATLLARGDRSGKTIYLAYSNQPDLADLTRRLAAAIGAVAPVGLRYELHDLSGESHGTIYHPAALQAFRAVFAPRH